MEVGGGGEEEGGLGFRDAVAVSFGREGWRWRVAVWLRDLANVVVSKGACNVHSGWRLTTV